MANFQPITLPGGKPGKDTGDDDAGTSGYLDVKMEDYITTARELLNDAGDNMEQQTEAIVEIVNQLVGYNNPVKMMRYVDKLAKEFKIKKGDFTLAIKEAQAAQKEEAQEDGESSPLVSRVEQYITKRYKIYFNVVANRFMYKEHDAKEFSEMNEHNIYRELQKAHLKYSMSDLRSLLKSDFVEKRNVFVEYFEDLPPWDGEDHIGNLSTYIKVQNMPGRNNEQERFERMFKKMFVRSVACSLEADFNKQCFTFVHEKQNSGKSSFMRWLCPPRLEDYYTENIGTSKDDLIALTENFIVNIDELSTLSKYDINALKSVMSKQRVKVRLPYGERPELLQRRCNFVASTNRLEFLNDETGSVRWICFLLDKIVYTPSGMKSSGLPTYELDIDINKVWAQAYHLFKETNFDYQLTPAEIEENEQANKTFLIRSPEMELIQRYMEPSTPKAYEEEQKMGGEKEIVFLTATDILSELHKKNVSNIKMSSVNVGKSLKILGFEQHSKYRDDIGISIKGYYLKFKNDLEAQETEKENNQPEKQPAGKQNDLPF
jgi:hypothetical protein